MARTLLPPRARSGPALLTLSRPADRAPGTEMVPVQDSN